MHPAVLNPSRFSDAGLHAALRSMLLRTVRMTFHPERLADFHALFAATRERIAAAPGCRSLELWQDPRYPGVLTTVSRWDGPDALEAYRASDLFRDTWAQTTPLFAAPPVATSHVWPSV